MGTYTASILVGTAHTYHGGIIPTHQLFLSENDRPAWILMEIGGEGTSSRRIVWIPTLENMLEDALLMVAIYVLKDSRIVREAERRFRVPLYGSVIELYRDIEGEDRRMLYELCKRVFRDHELKLTLTIMSGSYISNQVEVLREYPVECEVCVARFARSRKHWGSKELGEFHEVNLKISRKK